MTAPAQTPGSPLLPTRQPDDGPIEVNVTPRGVAMAVETGGARQYIVCSEYNAARLLASLCLILGVPMPRALGKMKM